MGELKDDEKNIVDEKLWSDNEEDDDDEQQKVRSKNFNKKK